MAAHTHTHTPTTTARGPGMVWDTVSVVMLGLAALSATAAVGGELLLRAGSGLVPPAVAVIDAALALLLLGAVMVRASMGACAPRHRRHPQRPGADRLGGRAGLPRAIGGRRSWSSGPRRSWQRPSNR